MENEIDNKPNLIFKTIEKIKRRKKTFILFSLSLVSIIIIIFLLDNLQKKENIKVGEKYIQAGIFLSSGNKEQAKEIYQNIILSENKTYSLLALNRIAENELEQDTDEVIKLFKNVENIMKSNEQKNLIKIKRALYLIKISKISEANQLLEKVISDESKWKSIASELLK